MDVSGYELRRKPKSQKKPKMTHFESCLHVLLGFRDRLNIVQVGANDGVNNDPLHGFVLAHAARTRVILCEPQTYLIPELEKTYQFHNAKYIFNGAVGPDPSLVLHRIKKAFFRDFTVPYAKDWPEYRAPTGVTSANYEHVAAWVADHYTGKRALGEIIETVTVDCMRVDDLLKSARLFDTFDVLQVDAEGFDDEVIYASGLETFRPSIVNFEYDNLSSQKAAKLSAYLIEQGYVLTRHGMDGLALRVS